MPRTVNTAVLFRELVDLNKEVTRLGATVAGSNGEGRMPRFPTGEEVTERKLEMSLSGFSSVARDKALQWLLKDSSSTVIRRLENDNRVLRVKLAGKLDDSDNGKRFDRVDLYIAPSLGVLFRQPAESLRFDQHRQVLIVVDNFDSSTDTRRIRWITEAAHWFGAVWFWKTSPTDDSILNDLHQEVSFHSETLILPTLTLSADSSPSSLDLLTDRFSDFRTLLNLVNANRWSHIVSSKIAESISTNLTQLEQEANEAGVRAKSLEALSTKDIEKTSNEVTQKFRDHFESLESELETALKEARSDIGVVYAAAVTQIAALDIAAMEKVKQGDEDCFVVADSRKASLRTAVEESVRKHAEHQLLEFNRLLARLRTSLTKAAMLATGENIELPSRTIDLQRIARLIPAKIFEGHVDDIRVKRLGVLGVLGRGRQKFFMVLMITMLLPRLGLDQFMESLITPTVSSALAVCGVGFFVSCLVCVIYDYRADVKKQKAQAIQKLRESVTKETIKSVSQIHETIQAEVRSQLQDIGYVWGLEIKRAYASLIHWTQTVRRKEIKLSRRSQQHAEHRKDMLTQASGKLIKIQTKYGDIFAKIQQMLVLATPKIPISQISTPMSAPQTEENVSKSNQKTGNDTPTPPKDSRRERRTSKSQPKTRASSRVASRLRERLEQRKLKNGDRT